MALFFSRLLLALEEREGGGERIKRARRFLSRLRLLVLFPVGGQHAGGKWEERFEPRVSQFFFYFFFLQMATTTTNNFFHTYPTTFRCRWVTLYRISLLSWFSQICHSKINCLWRYHDLIIWFQNNQQMPFQQSPSWVLRQFRPITELIQPS